MDVVIKVSERLAPLAEAMVDLPRPDVLVTHYRAGDTWARENIIPAGTVMIGAYYKKAHILVLSHGHLEMNIDGSKVSMKAPSTIVVKPGSQKAILALEDSVLTGFFSSTKDSFFEVASEYITNPNEQLIMANVCELVEVE